MLTLTSAFAQGVHRVQMHKNNSLALLLPIFSILNSDWLQHAGLEMAAQVNHIKDLPL